MHPLSIRESKRRVNGHTVHGRLPPVLNLHACTIYPIWVYVKYPIWVWTGVLRGTNVNMPGELLRGREQSLHGDSAYHSKELTAQAVGVALRSRSTSAAPGAVHRTRRRRHATDGLRTCASLENSAAGAQPAPGSHAHEIAAVTASAASSNRRPPAGAAASAALPSYLWSATTRKKNTISPSLIQRIRGFSTS